MKILDNIKKMGKKVSNFVIENKKTIGASIMIFTAANAPGFAEAPNDDGLLNRVERNILRNQLEFLDDRLDYTKMSDEDLLDEADRQDLEILEGVENIYLSDDGLKLSLSEKQGKINKIDQDGWLTVFADGDEIKELYAAEATNELREKAVVTLEGNVINILDTNGFKYRNEDEKSQLEDQSSEITGIESVYDLMGDEFDRRSESAKWDVIKKLVDRQGLDKLVDIEVKNGLDSEKAYSKVLAETGLLDEIGKTMDLSNTDVKHSEVVNTVFLLYVNEPKWEETVDERTGETVVSKCDETEAEKDGYKAKFIEVKGVISTEDGMFIKYYDEETGQLNCMGVNEEAFSSEDKKALLTMWFGDVEVLTKENENEEEEAFTFTIE
ncbi:MAG: hypothetical protein N4A47_00720 [Clostridia bacterium]|jgi:hypothetical protein|nr:hypothetical protein [Clostridia bacterium]